MADSKNPSRPSSAGASAPIDVKSTATPTAPTTLARPSTSCTCSSPPAVEESEIPPVPQIDPESSAKIPVVSVTPTKPTLNVVPDPVSRQPSPMLKPEDLELKLKEAYLAGYKQVEEFFHKTLESLNFYKQKSSSLETEVQQLREAKAKLEERIRALVDETQDWEQRREEREKRKEGKAINKVRRLIWSGSLRHKARTEGSTMPVTTAVEAK